MKGLLLLLCALLLLESTEGKNSYDQLSQQHREIVDKAIEKATNQFGGLTKQLLGFSSVINANDEKRMLHVLLKPTSCVKKPDIILKNCKIQEKAKPQVSCVKCEESMSCFLLKDYAKSIEAEHKCSPRLTGVGTLLSHKGPDEQKTGCLGCI